MISDLIYKNKTIIGGILILIIVFGALLLIFARDKEKEEIKITKSQDSNIVIIDIEGAVNNPGIYKLEIGSLIQDAINLAGGLTDEADHDRIAKDINRAQELKNGQKIYLPPKSSVPQGSVSGTETSGMININTAGAEELDSLPGIGPAYAQRIIDYRVENGGFSSIEGIMEVRGIGEKTFEKIKDRITI